jgi:ornithine carbamoyltransferase
MSVSLRNRSLLTVQDYSPREFRYLLDLARDLKHARRTRTERKHLRDKGVCLIVEKSSTRTRCAFEIACHDQGAHISYLDQVSAQIGNRESFKDTARALGRMFDAIEYRGVNQYGIEQLTKWAGVPVFHGLSAEHHPTQTLADVMTMREHSDKPLHQIKYAFLGNTRNNVGHSLMIAGCLLGMDVRLCGPKALWPAEDCVTRARSLQERSGAALTITDEPSKAVDGVDFVHTDIWVSAGEPRSLWRERIELLLRYQVNKELMKAARNAQVRFMHCLPSFHDGDTMLGKDLTEAHGLRSGLEVTDDVFESDYNLAFEQAENRMHAIKALLVATLGD